MATYENTGQFDLDLQSSGNGWLGTFAHLLDQAVADILDAGPYGPVVEVTLNGGEKVTGVLSFGMGDGAFKIDHRVVEVDDVLRFRA